MSEEEQVIRDWLAGQLSESGGPLPPARRRSQPLPRRQVVAVVATLIEEIDRLRAAPRAATEPLTDPEDRWRLVRIATELLSRLGTRDDSGRRIVGAWGEPDEAGIYTPTFTVEAPDPIRGWGSQDYWNGPIDDGPPSAGDKAEAPRTAERNDSDG